MQRLTIIVALLLGLHSAVFAEEAKNGGNNAVNVGADRVEKKVENKVAYEPTSAPASQPAAAQTRSIEKSPVPKVAPAVDPDDVTAIIKAIIESAKTGRWALLVGFIVMLLTWVVDRLLKQKIPSNVMPWLAIGLATIGTSAFALATGTGWLNAIIVGIQTGLTAAGGWSAIGKYIPGLARPTTKE